MAQWGQGQQQGFQYPMQTGFPAQNQQNPQFQQQNPQFLQQNPQQFQQPQQFQPGNAGLIPQQTGFPGQRLQGFQQPQQTGFQGGSGFLQPQATGFPGGNFQQSRSAPPVPPIPSQFQQPNQTPNFLNFPPPQQPNRLLNASPGFGGGGLLPQATGIGGGMRPLVPQATGYVDPRISMMTQTFMPTNTSAPYGPGGVPQLPQQQTNLVQSIQQHNQAQRGSANQQMSWALTKAEKKNYNNIFRTWDAQNTGFISGPTALEVFGASGLPKDDLARIWTLADIEDRGKLNIAEFHIAMGLIYRRLNGMPVPDTLPQELVPPSARDLEDTVSQVKGILDLMPARSTSPSRVGQPESRMRDRSFMGNSSANLDRSRDATIYKYNDSEPPGGYYKPRSRHVDRDAVRAREDDDSPSADLSDMKRQLANTASRLDRDADERSRRTKEDEELDQEMEDLKYRVKRVQDDLDYVGRGPRTASKEEERRRLEREMLNLLHERIPEVERKIKARDERKEKEKRQWARERDRANDRFGRYDSKDTYLSSSRDDDRDRPYSRNSDRDRPYSRGAYDRDDRDRERERDRDRSRDVDRDRDYGSRPPLSPLSREVDYGRNRTPPPAARSPPPPPPAAAPPSLIRDPPPAPAPAATPTPSLRNMTPAERQAFAKAEAQRRIQERMAKLGVVAPSSSPALDTSVESRLAQEKKEAEEKARLAEKQAEEREQARKERLANEKALREEPAPPKPTPTVTAPPPAPTPPVSTPKAATPKAAPPPPAKRGPAPPPPRRGGAPAPPAPRAPVAPPPAPVAPPAALQVDEEAAERARQEEALRAREAALRKAKEDREAAFQERLRQLEREEEEETKRQEQQYQERLAALKAKKTPTPSPIVETPPAAPPAPPPPAPPAPPAPAAASSVASTPAEKSTNPFSRLINQGGAGASAPTTPSATANGNVSPNPWAKPASPVVAPPAPKSPGPAGKPKYPTAPSEDDSDWGDVKENDEDDDSSDDEITSSRAVRANIAQTLFGGMMPRPTSAAASGPSSKPATPVPGGAAGGASPPPPPPPPPAAPRAPIVVKPEATPADRGALLQSIQGGLKLRKAVTVDKSGPPVSGKVLGDTAPPAHINTAARPVSPPTVRVTPPPVEQPAAPEAPAMDQEDTSRASNRQSVGWFADRAADAGSGTPPAVHHLPSTLEVEEEENFYTPATPSASVPEITVNEPAADATSGLMADIDKSTQHHVRSLYAFQGDGPEDLSFGENLVLLANPSKSGGDWWYGKTVNTGKAGLFPKTYVEVYTPKKAKAIYSYTGNNPDELPFAEGDVLSIVDTSEDEWWKAEQGGVVFIVPAGYLELEG